MRRGPGRVSRSWRWHEGPSHLRHGVGGSGGHPWGPKGLPDERLIAHGPHALQEVSPPHPLVARPGRDCPFRGGGSGWGERQGGGGHRDAGDRSYPGGARGGRGAEGFLDGSCADTGGWYWGGGSGGGRGCGPGGLESSDGCSGGKEVSVGRGGEGAVRAGGGKGVLGHLEGAYHHCCALVIPVRQLVFFRNTNLPKYL